MFPELHIGVEMLGVTRSLEICSFDHLKLNTYCNCLITNVEGGMV